MDGGKNFWGSLQKLTGVAAKVLVQNTTLVNTQNSDNIIQQDEKVLPLSVTWSGTKAHIGEP